MWPLSAPGIVRVLRGTERSRLPPLQQQQQSLFAIKVAVQFRRNSFFRAAVLQEFLQDVVEYRLIGHSV